MDSDAQPSSPASIAIDEEGDLRLFVGQATTYMVCSKALARSSRVWKRLLYGGFIESKPDGDGPWTVALPDDNPASMKIILDIIHGRFDQVPARGGISLEDLYSLTILTDKYNLTHLLLPWAHDWMEAKLFLFQEDEEGAGLCMENLLRGLWISWEIGDRYIFEYILMRVAYRTSLTQDGHLGYWNSPSGTFQPLFKDVLEPPGMTGKETISEICTISAS